jgi:hypothetical protein
VTRLGANEGPCPRHKAYVIARKSANTSKQASPRPLCIAHHHVTTVQSAQKQRVAGGYCTQHENEMRSHMSTHANHF